MSWLLVGLLGTMSTLALAEETLYNGIVLPDVWPPRRKELKREPMSPPYLKNPPKVIPIDVGRQLLVDDFLIEKSGLKRTFHRPTYHKINPVIKADQPWETSGKSYFVAPFQGRVLYDPSDQLFKMWYLHSTKGDYYCNSLGYATSKDGIHWEKPVFTESKKPDAESVSPKKGTNLVLQGRRTCCNSVILDHNAKSPDERFKMFSSDHYGKWNCVYRTSPDGIHWSGPVVKRPVWGDYVLAFYNPFRRMWVYEARIHGGTVGRCRAYMENPNSRKLAERVPHNNRMSVEGDSVYWVGADDLDPRNPDPRFKNIKPQLYSLAVAPYESLMLGLFAIWTGPDNATVAKEGLQKHNQILTGFSRDGFYWARPDRKPFISPSWKKGTWNFGNAQPVGGCCLIVGDKLYIYFSARLEDKTGMHGNATTGLALLRRDGFASLQAGDRAGSMTTRPLTFKGKHLFVNADCPKGELKAEVLDKGGKAIEPFTLANCKAVSCDKTLAAVTWQAAADLSAVSGKPVRFRFHLKNGSLYAFWVSPDASGASHGYVAAGGPGFTGPTDTVGMRAYRQSDRDGFVPIFDGKTLAGWHAVPKASASDWTVHDGAIVGRGSADRLSYLVWKDKHLTDFELKLSYRLPKKGNTGVEIRCQPDLTGKRPFEGYHADLGHVGIGPHILGAWDFHFARRKEYPCNRGTRLVIDADGKAHSSAIRGAVTLADIRRRQWNDVHIIARGRHFKFFINGKLASEFTDNAKQGRLDQGAVALQIHDKGMHVEFKDLRLKRLTSTTAGRSERPMPTVDISGETNRHVVVAAGTKSVYQGHPHTLLLADGKTMFCVWTLIHGHGAPRMKRSDDGGKSWSKLLALPEGWAPYGHCPTLHRIVAPDKKEHLLLMDRTGRSDNFAQAISRDNGKTWTPMKPNGLKGIVAPISIVSVDGGKKHLMWTHRGAGDKDRSPLAVWQGESADAGLTWKNYHKVCEVTGKDPCEPAVVRSPGGKQLLMLIRENKHKGNSLMMLSDDEGKTWSKPRQTSWGLTGDRHCARYAPDGRLVVVFRDVAQPCPPRGHFVAWVGRYEDIVKGREGQYRIKLMHHHGRAGDTGYAGLELLGDGTFVATTYIKHKPGPEKHSVVSVRFKLDEIDKKLKARK